MTGGSADLPVRLGADPPDRRLKRLAEFTPAGWIAGEFRFLQDRGAPADAC
jgi:hypothetical protein